MLIEVQELSHTFAAGTPLSRQALRNVSFRVEPGARIGIAGNTGSGKSTLMQLVAGLLRPSSGRVLLDGTPAHERSAVSRRRRQRVGIAFQYPEDQVFERTVFREVGFGPHNLGLRDRELANRVTWALDMVGLNADEMKDRIPFRLSGGELRRVALASTLALQPDVLILDEPTAGLDPHGRAQLLEHITEWQNRTRQTLILVSHDLTALTSTVDRLFILQQGRIAAAGPARRLLSEPDALRSSGLDPLPIVGLLEQLKAEGVPVRTDRFLPKEAAVEIVRALGTYRETR